MNGASHRVWAKPASLLAVAWRPASAAFGPVFSLPLRVLGPLLLASAALAAAIAWLTVQHPLPTFGLAGVAAAGALARAAARRIATRRAAGPSAAAAHAAERVPLWEPAAVLIQSDLSLAGRLASAGEACIRGRFSGVLRAGAVRVEAGGSVEGEIRSETLVVGEGGAVRGRVVQARLGVATGGLIEATVSSARNG